MASYTHLTYAFESIYLLCHSGAELILNFIYMPLFITRSALDNAIEESAAEIQETLLTLVTKEEFNKLDAKVSTLDTKVSTLDSKVTALDLKVSNLDS